MSAVYPPNVEIQRSAAISGDEVYRFNLSRRWGLGTLLTFVMLNPSTADADQDDPTIRRCVGFARTLGYDGINVVNLYAFRATKPADLWLAAEPTGGERNDDLLREIGRCAEYGMPVVAAWGANAKRDRVNQVLTFRGWDKITALGLTKSGAPRHPLYLPASATPTPWAAR